MKSGSKLIKVSAIILTLFLLIGFQVKAADSEDEIVLGDAGWPGIKAKNAVFQTIVGNIGHEIKVISGSGAMLQQGVARGDVDVYLDTWLPARKEEIEPIKDQLDIVATNMDEGLYTMAVFEHSWKAGVKSHADLVKYADKFDRTLHVGKVGWAAYGTMKEAVEKDIYGLGDWELQTSNETALLAVMEQAARDKEWLVFVAWRPHWMNHAFDIKYLKDPKGLWENPESIAITLARQGFKKDKPEVYKFLTQFKIDVKDNSQWIYEISRKEKDPRKMAKEWITNNWGKVEEWLEGVKAVNGEPAIKVLKESLE